MTKPSPPLVNWDASREKMTSVAFAKMYVLSLAASVSWTLSLAVNSFVLDVLLPVFAVTVRLSPSTRLRV